ncbi:hypothetical protein [Nocardiopsis synnemataformans]|uniref:hypothetical protein n=1 Tax=Nocardiopsis synnemataformans TaxID=61305 RepID=UPI003EBC5766
MEIWNADFADWRRFRRPETQILHPIGPNTSPITREYLWVQGCCGRYICKCPCQTAVSHLPEPVDPMQPTLFEGTG